MAEIWELGLAQIANLIASRTLSSVEVVDHYLARIDAIDPKVHSYVHIDQDSVRADARAADAELQRGHLMGPLHGVPVAIKDIIDIAGQPTTNGSRLHLDNVASEDAFVISQLRSAGAIMLGKLDTHEFAIGGPDFSLPFPPARNPWDLSRFTGGSSSGSGAAVAAGLAPLALGTDTGGSVRTPSAYCGLAGMKPTYGAVSRHGITQQAYSMETSGPLTWTVRDNALALQAMIGFDPRDAASVAQVSTHYGAALDLGVHGLRIGLVRNFHEDEPDSFTDEIVGAFEHAAAILQSAGAELHEIRLSPLSQYFATQRVLMYGEAAAFHENDLMNRKDLYG